MKLDEMRDNLKASLAKSDFALPEQCRECVHGGSATAICYFIAAGLGECPNFSPSERETAPPERSSSGGLDPFPTFCRDCRHSGEWQWAMCPDPADSGWTTCAHSRRSLAFVQEHGCRAREPAPPKTCGTCVSRCEQHGELGTTCARKFYQFSPETQVCSLYAPVSDTQRDPVTGMTLSEMAYYQTKPYTILPFIPPNERSDDVAIFDYKVVRRDEMGAGDVVEIIHSGGIVAKTEEMARTKVTLEKKLTVEQLEEGIEVLVRPFA